MVVSIDGTRASKEPEMIELALTARGSISTGSFPCGGGADREAGKALSAALLTGQSEPTEWPSQLLERFTF